ncbi:MAG: hypothetical protein HQK51_11125 [Oligoflexia bacterium]|nr:hypothetical protein [Oligoflexia bacterium]
MKNEFLIESLNVKSGEALTLEKAEDRVEFEALISFGSADQPSSNDDLTCSCYDSQKCWDWW